MIYARWTIKKICVFFLFYASLVYSSFLFFCPLSVLFFSFFSPPPFLKVRRDLWVNLLLAGVDVSPLSSF